jgi:oligoribonuclease NrnB/cAMP/cGMP phosphodiesterase (DHH superfamily)
MHSLRIIDHHASSQREWEPHLRGLLYNPKVCVVFDENRSGCVMAWRHYMDEMTIPKVFLIVQDHDLWHFNMAGTAEIIAGLYANGFVRKEDWNAISTLVQSETLLTHVHDHGRIVLAAQRELLENLLPRNTTLTSFMGEHAIPMANVPYDYNSKAGEMLYEKYESAPFVITYEDWHSKGVRKFSLRSHPERGADVSVLARKMGGGGHIHAAGFILKFDDLLNYPELLTPGK